MANTLFLRLEGPFQSWGERGQWSVRDTAPEPTKSGIVGLLACALGWRQNEEIQSLSQAIELGIRCDRPGIRVTDYHTVGGGYREPQLLQADGKPKGKVGNPHTEITWRDYLCDASFLAVIRSTPDWVDRLALAVQNPHWVLFLGRKSCPPSRPLFEGTGEYATTVDALVAWPWRRADIVQPGQIPVRAVVESQPHQGIRRRHEILARTKRVFGPYYTRDIRVHIALEPEEV